ncbi:DNA gyrase/topoisomerase IV subunit A [Marinoscillum sp. MHG1-6]|uniref:DNA gyrase/topoisomerase IV subunit A n=1 Tax=Marinoscillum sp. MHG1-6 TaxID=2959627 RepID=UPI002157D52C|nr:DNA gyrase/topoisomerase IV subunit A [Marinoscillum sp. MHG1-6]
MSEELTHEEDGLHDVLPVSGMYESWFLDYASYVILERAVPAVQDGFKPVQRRILHAMKEMDDGRFNKVANIIGSTMQYHPHGDASISDAIVNLGQKDLLIDMQGNWGDVRTGDGAAAARYIEARLSKFALEVIYNPQTTDWQLSYDGRKKEPVTFPVKFPLLLAQGVEGIAVGLSTKILPHNFVELIHAAINILKNKKVTLYPDFLTGGKVDVSDYNDGLRGGKIRVRAAIEEMDSKTLVIKDIPYSTTTTSLIDSIIKANDKGKIKIKQVIDNTAAEIEIQVKLAPGVSPDITIDALYAFTDCEVSISPNACIIHEDKPKFLGVTEILKMSVDQTVELLKRELEIKKGELMEKILFSSLEKIFIENRIYRDIEECETWESVLETIDKGLDPYKPQFYREIVQDDIIKLTEIRIKRISKFDAFKADELMRKLEEELAETEHHLNNLTEYAITYYQNLLDKYGKGKERKTEIANFDTISATVVAANNAKLYVNREDGFIGYGLKKDEFVCDCSDIDDIIVFRKDGICQVTRIQDKVFVGKNILHVGVFKKGDERMVYNLIYLEGKSGRTMIKRFQVLSVTRDREYDLTKGTKGSKVLYFSANPNGEAETITVYLTAASKARKKVFDFDFSEIEIKGRGAGGNILTKYPVRKIQFKSAGVSTLGGLDVWYDEVVGRLNTDSRGQHLGNFQPEDNIIVFYKDGSYELTSFELTNRYEPAQIVSISRFAPDKMVNAVYMDGDSKTVYVKRFQIETTTANKRFAFISEAKGSKLYYANNADSAPVEVSYKDGRKKEKKEYDLSEMIDVKGWKAVGNKFPIQTVSEIAPRAVQQPVQEKDTEEGPMDLETLKDNIRHEVEDEENQLGLFGGDSSKDD